MDGGHHQIRQLIRRLIPDRHGIKQVSRKLVIWKYRHVWQDKRKFPPVRWQGQHLARAHPMDFGVGKNLVYELAPRRRCVGDHLERPGRIGHASKDAVE